MAAGVTRDHALKVEQMPVRRCGIDPAVATAEKLYRGYFTTSAGSNAMNALGSGAAPIKFSITSRTDRCLAILGMRILFESSSMDVSGNELRRFGAAAFGAPLTNGLTLQAIQGSDSTSIFLDPVLVAGDFFSYTDTFFNRVDGAAAGVDILNFSFVFEVPVVLPPGAADRLEFSVRDDLRLLASFKAIAFGTQELV